MRSHRSPAARRRLAWAAVLVTGVFAACSDRTPVEPSPDAEVTPRAVGAAAAAQEAHTPSLMSRDNVVGTAVGRTDDGRPAIVLYLLRGGPTGLPDQVEGIPVVHVVTGMFVAGADETSRIRPAPIGFSVGHPDITAGTIGARVVDGSGDVYVLSNNHVLANSNDASIGDATLQPGPSDGGTDPDDRIGQLADYEPIDFSNDNVMDAAIASTTTSDVDFSTPSDEGYGTPGTSPTTASVGTAVQKYGRTTGHTTGEVSETNVTVSVCYEPAGPFNCKTSATFVDQVSITPGSFSDGGDSGSLIVTDDSNASPVALLFAGSDTRTLGSPIGPVLQRFAVSVDDGSGGSDTNSAPTASFTQSCTDLSCDFDGTGSSDSDGSISSHEWDLGDGATASGQTASHTYASGGTYTVTLTVTDDDGATDTSSQDVTVEEATSSDITLSVSAQKNRGVRTVDLTWSGATSNQVDVYRDGTLVATTANDGAHTDDLGRGGGGSFTYRVCEAGTSTCSHEATASF